MGKLWGLTRGKDLDEKRKDSKKARKRLIFQIFYNLRCCQAVSVAVTSGRIIWVRD